MKKTLFSCLFTVVLSLSLFTAAFGFGCGPGGGWDFDITSIDADGTTLLVCVLNDSNDGYHGRIWININVDGYTATEEINLCSGHSRCIRFEIPTDQLFSDNILGIDPYAAAESITGSDAYGSEVVEKRVSVTITGGLVGETCFDERTESVVFEK